MPTLSCVSFDFSEPGFTKDDVKIGINFATFDIENEYSNTCRRLKQRGKRTKVMTRESTYWIGLKETKVLVKS